MVAKKLVISFVYDAIKQGFKRIVRQVDHQQAVSDAATATASDGPDGLTHDDLYDVFQTELNGGVLADASTDGEEIISSLADALADRHRSTDQTDIDYESIIADFLDRVERNLLSQGRPEEGLQVLYQYARETESITENIHAKIEQLYQRYVDDLEELSRYSNRMVPSEHRYRPSNGLPRIDQPVETDVKETIEKGDSVVLTGQAGSGKSGILAHLYKRWQGNRPVYFLDAREFGRLRSRGELKSELGLKQSVTDVFRRVGAEAGCCTIIVDQLDNVRTEDAATLFTNLLSSLAALDSVTVVCACRRWDLDRNEFRTLRENSPFAIHTVSALSKDTASDALVELGVERDDQVAKLVILCQNLLNLALLADAMSVDGTIDPRQITREGAVWDAYRESLKLEGSRSGGSVPHDWEETPIERAVTHARSSLRQSQTTFSTEDSNPADQRLISRRTIEQDWKAMYRFRHDQLQAYFYAWDQVTRNRYVQAVLDTGIDERVAADVFEWMLKLYLDDDSRTTRFLREGLGTQSPLGFYARLRIIEAAGFLGPDRLGTAQATVVVNALKADDRLAGEFYRTMESLNWARFMLNNELLSQSDTIVASYLADFAEEAPDLTVKAMQQYDPGSVDPAILRVYLSAIDVNDSFEAGQNEVAGETIMSWVEEFDVDELARLHSRLGTILAYFLQTDQTALATRLVSLLIQPDEEAAAAERDSDRVFHSAKVEAHVETRRLDRLFDEHTEKLYEVCGSEFISLLEEELWTCLDLVSQRFEEDIPTERAFRRPPFNARLNPWRLQDVLISTLETAVRLQMSADPDAAKERLQQYLDNDGLFREIAVHLLSKEPMIAPDAVAAVLTPPENNETVPLGTEFLRLLNSGYSVLSESDQQVVIEHIETGPDRVELEQALRERYELDSKKQLQEATQRRINRWRLKRFWQIRDDLSIESDARKQLDNLIDQYGQVKYEQGRGYVIEDSKNETKKTVQLDALDANSFVEYCLDYAQGSGPPADNPNTASLSDREPELEADPTRELRERIVADQETYLTHFPSIVEASTGNDDLVKTIFDTLDFLMIGVDHEDEEITEWDSIVEAYERFIEADPFNERWQIRCRRIAAEFLSHVIMHAKSTLDVSNHVQLFTDVVLQLTDDPDPVPDSPIEDQLNADQGLQNVRSPTVSGVRASGTTALVGLMINIEGAPVEAERTLTPLRNRLAELVTDDAIAVRFTLGRRLPTLHRYDSEFVKKRTEQLMPTGDSPTDHTHFISTWSGYINHNHLVILPVFEWLRPQYQHAIDLHRTADIEQHDQSLQPLCSHIAVAYTWEHLDIADELIETLLKVTQTDLALDQDNERTSPPGVYLARAFTNILEQYDEEEERYREHWQRIIEFWDSRLDAFSSAADAPEEFRAYARMLKYAPSETSLADIAPLLHKTAPAIQGDYTFTRVLEYVADETVTSRQEAIVTSKAAIRILDGLTESADVEIYLPASDECWTVVKTAAEDGHDTALEVAERLLEAGHPEYRQIIENHKYTDS